ncbi:MAG: acyl carrier protein [Candidatus Omnitrophica bacterium]|nr:acyl carrier protein [Candidatus Omnitrophota bacterium]
MSVEDKVKGILKEVLDLSPDEIQPSGKLDQSYGVDSTEMVEITVGLKKTFGMEEMENNSLNKGQSFDEIVEFLKSKGAA